MTQLTKARQGQATPEMEHVARTEGIHIQALMESMAAGRAVIPANIHRAPFNYAGVGEGLSVKVNANIGTSDDHEDLEEELAKAEAAQVAGAHAIMDLSTSRRLVEARRALLERTGMVVGTVPIYQAAVEAAGQDQGVVSIQPDRLFEIIEEQAADGVDFITVHSGLNLNAAARLKSQGRVTDVVSRGGAFLLTWMLYNEKENPLYEQYDRLLEIALKHDVTLSLGDGLRPGCLADATDRAQIMELITLGELADRAREAGVQVMIEGPGHVPLNQVETNVRIMKELTRGAPFYVLGPLVTDVAAGYDHIACAIGGALAGWHGADFLCYVTPAEHLRLPDVDDVREGVIAALIAAHAADLARGDKRALARDLAMAQARKELDWERQIALCIDPAKARRFHEQHQTHEEGVCTMCGKYCAIKLVREYLEGDK